MTDIRRKSAMIAVYCEEVKQIAWRLRRIRLDTAKAGHITHNQWVARTKLVAQARVLYSLRTVARGLAHNRIAERNAMLISMMGETPPVPVPGASDEGTTANISPEH